MAVNDIFSKRQARLRGDVPDIYMYDTLPQPLRIQLWQNVSEGIGTWNTSTGVANRAVQFIYKEVVYALRREYGVLELVKSTSRSSGRYDMEMRDHIFHGDTERVLDAIEMVCAHFHENLAEAHERGEYARRVAPILAEINTRFREHGVGYEFVSGEIVRIDSQLIHEQAVRPALVLLMDPLYVGAQEEFLAAHTKFRQGDAKGAITDAVKSFESVMKIIATKRGWSYDPSRATVKPLVDLMYENGLVPTYWQELLTGLKQILVGVGTPRNKQGAHGQGAAPQEVPDYLAAYVLHMTASTIVFLVNAEKALP